MKLFKKIFSVMLVLAMFFGTAFGSTTTKVYAAEQNEPMRVFSIDAGRKYFSEKQLKDIIGKAYVNGYTDVQILLGNDALRFYLDDMSITVNGTTYESDAVKAALKKGNDSYYADPNGDALTQKEMDRITAYAKERGINVIPVINSPGHMDSILVAMEELGIDSPRFTHEGKESERTVNINSADAIAFTKELVKKYVSYFAATGATKIFNFGADEYANDVFPTPGWGELQELGLYDEFIDYANDLAKIIKDAGLTPMCFNDGIYYNSNDTYGTFDKDIIISYWTAGWWGFYVAKPIYFVEKGHKILNTNDSWYWVLGNISDGGYKFEDTVKRIQEKGFNDVTGAKDDQIIPTIGSMQCVWCDFPSKEHDMDRIFQLMDQYSTKHADYFKRPVINKSALNDLIIKAEALDASAYTAASWDAVATALTNAKAVMAAEAATQAEVDAASNALSNAIAGLTTPTTSDKDDVKDNAVAEAAKTGDSLNITGLSVAMLAAGAVAISLKRRKNEA